MGTRPYEPIGTPNDSTAQLAPEQLREIREAFQILDRDNDGFITKEDVADVLQNAGTYHDYTEYAVDKICVDAPNRARRFISQSISVLLDGRSSVNELPHISEHPF